jgi:hypothetical protein
MDVPAGSVINKKYGNYLTSEDTVRGIAPTNLLTFADSLRSEGLASCHLIPYISDIVVVSINLDYYGASRPAQQPLPLVV